MKLKNGIIILLLSVLLVSCDMLGFVGEALKGDKGDKGEQGLSLIWMGTLEAPPEGPQKNWAYYNEILGYAYIYDGTAWQILASSGADGTDGVDGTNGTDGVSILWQGSFATPPLDPLVNWAYYNTTEGSSYIFDGTLWQVLAVDGSDGTDGADGMGYLSVNLHFYADSQDSVTFNSAADPASVGRSFRLYADDNSQWDDGLGQELASGVLPENIDLNPDFPGLVYYLSVIVPASSYPEGYYTIWMIIDDDDLDSNGLLADASAGTDGINDGQDLIYPVNMSYFPGNTDVFYQNSFLPSEGAVSWDVILRSNAINDPI